ncbi:MAG TPA: hypothetical protein VM123_19425, partial [archaeon]|nr:hypothetical protein [archaeon]
AYRLQAKIDNPRHSAGLISGLPIPPLMTFLYRTISIFRANIVLSLHNATEISFCRADYVAGLQVDALPEATSCNLSSIFY